MNSTLASTPRRPTAHFPARFPALTAAGVAAVAYLVLVGAGLLAWQRHAAGAVSTTATMVALAPVLLGAACAASSQVDRQQYVARLMAAAMMSPILLLFWSIDGPLAWGLGLAVALGSVVLHVAALLAGIAWLARLSTRIAPAAGVAPVEADTLRRRLASFDALGLPIQAAQAAASGSVQLRWQPDGPDGGWHVVHLLPDVAAGAMRVLERAGADGSAPASADEASMRSPIDDPFDPTRPAARRVWLRTLQTTVLDEAQLAAAPVALAGDRVRWVGPGAPSLAGTNALMACLAAVVVRSGWGWRPQLLA